MKMKRIVFISLIIVNMIVVVACSSDSNGKFKYGNLSTEKLMEKAEENDLEAITQLGRNAFNENNYDEAEKWYRKAAEQDYTVAIHNMGVIYSNLRNYEAAKEWYLKAVNKGYAYSAYNLGYNCLQQKDYNGAEEWFRKAKELGHEDAESALSALEQARPKVYTFSGGGYLGGMHYNVQYELTLNNDRTAEIQSTMNGYPQTIKASWEPLDGVIGIHFSNFREIILGKNLERTNWLYLYDGHVFFSMSAARAKDYEAGTAVSRR